MNQNNNNKKQRQRQFKNNSNNPSLFLLFLVATKPFLSALASLPPSFSSISQLQTKSAPSMNAITSFNRSTTTASSPRTISPLSPTITTTTMMLMMNSQLSPQNFNETSRIVVVS